MTLHAQRPISALAAALMAVAILTSVALAEGSPPTPGELAKYGWGAAATYAKAQKANGHRTTQVDRLTSAELAKYGWGAAATYAKAQRTLPTRQAGATQPTKAELATYGWGAAATYAKAQRAR
jgi:hypothetical protein